MTWKLCRILRNVFMVYLWGFFLMLSVFYFYMNSKTFSEYDIKEIISLDNVLIYGIWGYIKENQFSSWHYRVSSRRETLFLSGSTSVVSTWSLRNVMVVCLVEHQQKCGKLEPTHTWLKVWTWMRAEKRGTLLQNGCLFCLYEIEQFVNKILLDWRENWVFPVAELFP